MTPFKILCFELLDIILGKKPLTPDVFDNFIESISRDTELYRVFPVLKFKRRDSSEFKYAQKTHDIFLSSKKTNHNSYYFINELEKYVISIYNSQQTQAIFRSEENEDEYNNLESCINLISAIKLQLEVILQKDTNKFIQQNNSIELESSSKTLEHLGSILYKIFRGSTNNINILSLFLDVLIIPALKRKDVECAKKELFKLLDIMLDSSITRLPNWLNFLYGVNQLKNSTLHLHKFYHLNLINDCTYTLSVIKNGIANKEVIEDFICKIANHLLTILDKNAYPELYKHGQKIIKVEKGMKLEYLTTFIVPSFTNN